jgi:RNA polymerase sigma-70 factor, ECF subfamily
MATETADLADALERARSGDEAGFLELWRALQPRLLRYLRVLSCGDAEDVASETWLQVVRDLHRFSGSEDDFRRWLFTVGRHRAIDSARARIRRPVAALPPDAELLPDRQQVEDQVLDGLSVGAAIDLLAALPPDQAEAVALRVIAGLETAAAAEILGKSAGAVRVALHRGLRTLAGDPRLRAMAAGPRPPAATDRNSPPPAGLTLAANPTLAADATLPSRATDPALPSLAADPALPSLAADPALPSLAADPALPSLAADPALPSLAADPALPSLAADPALPSLAADPALPSLAADPALTAGQNLAGRPSAPANPVLRALREVKR